MIASTVRVIVDRPLGSVHPKHKDIVYAINYGYIPGVMGGDGEDQDVYILGVEEPLTRFTGRIIAAVRRRDDNEDKLVAAPEGISFSASEITDRIRFTEQYFDTTLQLFQEDTEYESL